VRIYSNAPAHVYAYFEKHFPGKTVLEQKTLTVASRKNDVEPHWGGACIVEHGSEAPYCDPDGPDGWCTSGFSVTTDGGRHRMVTAGHCFPLDTNVRSPLGTTFGSVTRNLWWGEVGNSGDMALLGSGTNDVRMGPAIYMGGSTGTQADVSNAGAPAGGTYYCFSGATSFENCLHMRTVTDYDMCGLDPSSPRACHYDLQLFESSTGKGACGGDSGSPFYLQNPGYHVELAHIRGMVVIGELNCGSTTLAGIETWPKIDSLMNVNIKTV
jgi:hypothetical protein